jgi:hypothetical protein
VERVAAAFPIPAGKPGYERAHGCWHAKHSHVMASGGPRHRARGALSWPEPESRLRTPQFDLIIVSAFLTNHEKERALALAAGATPTIVLPGLTRVCENWKTGDSWLEPPFA